MAKTIPVRIPVALYLKLKRRKEDLIPPPSISFQATVAIREFLERRLPKRGGGSDA